jgi:hypothetical protein
MLYYLTSTGNGLSPDDTLPPGAVACTEAQYQNAAAWTISGGNIVAVSAPPPTSDQVLASKIALGIAITSTGAPSISATYALDATTLDQIGSVARDFSSGLGLPGDIMTFTYPDATGQPRTFTGDQLAALYRKQRNLLAVLNTQAAIMAHGGTPVWPTQTATIA